MNQVIIDRGVYKLGIRRANGENTEPSWNSDIAGNSLIIGHEEETFAISRVDDVEFILKELSKRLSLNLVSKVIKEEYGECYACSRCNEVFDNQELPEDDSERKFCYNCGAVLDWNDVINGEVED